MSNLQNKVSSPWDKFCLSPTASYPHSGLPQHPLCLACLLPDLFLVSSGINVRSQVIGHFSKSLSWSPLVGSHSPLTSHITVISLLDPTLKQILQVSDLLHPSLLLAHTHGSCALPCVWLPSWVSASSQTVSSRPADQAIVHQDC